MTDKPAQTKSSRTRVLQFMHDHIRRYLETDGEDGHLFNGIPSLLLTTTDRNNGTAKQVALFYGQHDGNYIIVASMGGADVDPGWYKDLLANPLAKIQVKSEHRHVRARTANDEEKPLLWEKMAAIYPSYNDYQAATQRRIPIAILEIV